MIDGVAVKTLVRHPDERGYFEEMIRSTDAIFVEGFGQVSHSFMVSGVVKAWHVHKTQIDWWYVVRGVIKTVLYDNRKDSKTYKELNEFILGKDEPNTIVKIPPGVAHGLKVLKGSADLVYITSGVYSKDEEGRIPFNDSEIGYDWVQGMPITNKKYYMKLLITGGAGFIGANFIRYWATKYPKDEIRNIDKLTYAGNPENLKGVSQNFIHGDIADKSVVFKAMESVDVVVHFAAETHVDRSISQPSPFITTNIVGTHVLLEAALKNGVKRFHHISTDEVFGSLALGSQDKFNEDTTYNPRSPYSASKASSDHLVRAYYHTYGLPVTITNCSNNFGPYQFPEKLIPLTITNILENKKVPVYGDGKNIRDWLYVEDHCRAIDAILTRGKIGETYCVGGLTQDIDNLTVVKKILSYMGKDESVIEFVKDRLGHDRRYAIDWTKIHRELGWKPEHDFDTYLVKTIEWYKKNVSWWKPLK